MATKARKVTSTKRVVKRAAAPKKVIKKKVIKAKPAAKATTTKKVVAKRAAPKALSIKNNRVPKTEVKKARIQTAEGWKRSMMNRRNLHG